jgi:hypothetical protein
MSNLSPEHQPSYPNRDLSSLDDPYLAAAEQAMHGLVVVDNGPVYGLLGNARNDILASLVQSVKGESRDPTRPLGLTVPFDTIQAPYDTTHIQDIAVRDLIKDASALTEHLGGLAFVRGRVNESLIGDHLPSAIVSNPKNMTHNRRQAYPEIQIYSPAGNTAASRIIQLMLDNGGLPVMTSANYTGQPEIITEKDAREFAAEQRLPIYVARPDGEKDMRPRSSYPILQVTDDGMTVIRTGFMDAALIRALVPSIPLSIDTQPNKHDEKHILRHEDLPDHLADATGPNLRRGLLQIMGVS